MSLGCTNDINPINFIDGVYTGTIETIPGAVDRKGLLHNGNSNIPCLSSEATICLLFHPRFTKIEKEIPKSDAISRFKEFLMQHDELNIDTVSVLCISALDSFSVTLPCVWENDVLSVKPVLGYLRSNEDIKFTMDSDDINLTVLWDMPVMNYLWQRRNGSFLMEHIQGVHIQAKRNKVCRTCLKAEQDLPKDRYDRINCRGNLYKLEEDEFGHWRPSLRDCDLLAKHHIHWSSIYDYNDVNRDDFF